MVYGRKELVRIFSDHYINIVERSSGKKQEIDGNKKAIEVICISLLIMKVSNYKGK